jgi:type II secretory pathway pseudopilin PulG
MTTHPARRRPAAFTIVELLVVMGIIVVLIGILVPVVGKVRTAAYATKTQQTLSRLQMAIDTYYNDFKAYPGPFSNEQVSRSTTNTLQPNLRIGGAPKYLTQSTTTPGTLNLAQITGSENLLLGLCGGVSYVRSGTNAGDFYFDIDRVGKGAKNLSTLEGKQDFGKQYPVYFDLKPGDITVNATDKTGSYIDSGGAAADTIIPEFLDGFPNGMPILYIRAYVGAQGVAFDSKTPPAAPLPRQYDLQQVYGYTNSTIGVGRPTSLRSKYTTAADFTANPHGLHTVVATTSLENPPPSGFTYVYPYDLFAYLRDPAAQYDPTPATGTASGAPKRKDAYILISPGIDRTYGTEDDITNFGSVTGK